MRNSTGLVIGVLAAVFALGAGQTELAPAPPSAKKPHADTYHGVRVVDDYRWLEHGSDPEVRAWTEAQSRRTRSFLESQPAYNSIYHTLEHLELHRSATYSSMQYCSGSLFALKVQPGAQQPVLVRMKSADEPASEHVVVDPNKIDPAGGTAIELFVPSRDAKRVAVVLASNGSEQGEARVYEVATGRPLKDIVRKVQSPTALASIAWNDDGSGFYYTHFPESPATPEDAFFNQQVYFHKLDTPSSEDRYVIGKDFPRIAEITLQSSEDGKYVLATVENGDGGEFEHFLLSASVEWKQLARFADKVSAAVFGPDQALYMLSHDNASRGKILRLSLATPDLSRAVTIVPEGEGAIAPELKGLSYTRSLLVTANRLYVAEVLGGPMQVRVFDHAGKFAEKLPLGPVASLEEMVKLDGDDIVFESSSFVQSSAWFHYDTRTQRAHPTALRMHPRFAFGDAKVEREFAVSRDGTKIPLSIVHGSGTALDGKHPTILLGYGGYGISETPFFNPMLRAWLDAGGVFAVANLRGGGEYGETWHRAGRLTQKQNTFDDFVACAQHLIRRGYTNPGKLAIEGGSNGGLTVAAAMTQHPELFRAVVGIAGLYDMLRLESYPNGQFNATEYGSVKDPEQFRAMYAYSPYQHVADGAKYPAVLLMCGENDGRVDPGQSRKMAARLQAATGSELPVLLENFASTGHGRIGAALKQKLAISARAWTFLYHELGVPYRQRHL
ncbi:MAG: S9 family peptidase [Acidobacteria bacterium]|nr:S9 family peptidase [Acidobacteriota bacterium]